ncbi:DEP domain-containing protein 1A isoform X1 [Takifugu rubripes]|uniref:DEP domain containing 1a n=1 Tax=Takifugu rubripes TaxID=31033 RepID=H2SGB5_TAKRU|nr:DEP domain-containing protein 1A isoform X1 [Takifugu rubripes]
MSSHIITPGPYRATKLWNEVTRLFRAGMPLKKHRQNFRHHASCFSATAAVDWLHQLLCNNSNFGPDVTRQQTVQLLKKFLKNHVIEDVKGRWGTEDLEDNNVLYRFPSTSPLKPIPCPPPAAASHSIRKRPSFRDKESFFRLKGVTKQEKEDNLDPAASSEGENQHADQPVQRRQLTVEDEQEIWRCITLTHLQKILGVESLDEVLDRQCVNPLNIIHNMTKVNKHGVVTLEDKTNDLPHWVLNAMKSLANWPKYDSDQPTYPGFERDVFKTVSDHFYSLPQPLLTYDLYELFINTLVFCGYVPTSTVHQRGKRKKADLPSAPPPAKAPFPSTECLLLSLLRQGGCDEAESPMRDVLSGKLQSRSAALEGGTSAGVGHLGGSCMSLSTAGALRYQTRSCSLETILDDSSHLSRQKRFLSSDSLASCGSRSGDGSCADSLSRSVHHNTAGGANTNRLSVGSVEGLSVVKRPRPLRPRSVGSCLDIVVETREEDEQEPKWQGRSTSCLSVGPSEHHGPSNSSPTATTSCLSLPSSSLAAAQSRGSNSSAGAAGPRPAISTSNLQTHSAPTVVRRCLSSFDISKRASVCQPNVGVKPQQPKTEHSILQPQAERVAIEALQICTLLLPPSSRRKLQLLMRMMCRISQNVDMPRLHPAIGTRTLMVHTFSGCILGSAEECDLDELLATRLVSFLLDHQEHILSVPGYLLSAINDHIQYLRTAQIPVNEGDPDGGDGASAPVSIHTFCHQISGTEFEQQKLASSQKAMEELLEMLLTDQNLNEKQRCKKLKQFQKLYPDIYSQRFPPSEQLKKPKIKPPLLNIKKTKVFSIRN